MYKSIFTIAIVALMFNTSIGQDVCNDCVPDPQALKEFQDLKFGLFIHWGPVTLRGTEIGWSRGTDMYRENFNDVSIQEYDNLYKEFNPVLFNADDWVQTAKKAGMKYLVITAKHHDGFCLWDTKYTDYNIMNGPLKRDVLKELAEACKRHGMKFGVYYSVADWLHPDYPMLHRRIPREPGTFNVENYWTYMKNQVTEIIEKYDPFLLWFDLNHEKELTHEDCVDFYKYLKDLKPTLLVNDRIDKRNDSTILHKVGDYKTSEQKVGSFNLETPWETCMTICKQWAWKPNDEMKSREVCLETFCKVIGGNGNLLFNVGPMLDGRIEQRQINRLAEIGQWVKANEAAVYGTIAGPYKPQDSFVSTRNGKDIFIHIIKDVDKLELDFPDHIKVKKVNQLDSGRKVDFNRFDGRLKLSLKTFNQIPYVIRIETNTEVESIDIIQ